MGSYNILTSSILRQSKLGNLRLNESVASEFVAHSQESLEELP